MSLNLADRPMRLSGLEPLVITPDTNFVNVMTVFLCSGADCWQ